MLMTGLKEQTGEVLSRIIPKATLSKFGSNLPFYLMGRPTCALAPPGIRMRPRQPSLPHPASNQPDDNSNRTFSRSLRHRKPRPRRSQQY